MSIDRVFMIRLFFLVSAMLIPVGLLGQSDSKNYFQRKTFLDEAGSAFLRHIDYYDELGYVSETMDVGGNTTQTPIAVKMEYSPQLKLRYQWTPVPTTGLDYLGIDGVADAASGTYSDDMPYSEFEYDDFQQLASSRKPGEAWEGHPVTVTRSVVPSGVVKKYAVAANGELRDDGTYPYGMLTCTTTTDEDGRSLTVYNDMNENTILERRGQDNDTYYVYDDYGRLSYVLPPMCQQCTPSELPKYWYKYAYDARGRCVEKQLPGCEAVRYWYDEANRIQSEQDGHLRGKSLYRNYSYDGTGRVVLQVISSSHGEATEDNAVTVETKNYYDDYSCRQELSQLFSIWADSINATATASTVTKGRLTARLCMTSEDRRYFEMFRYDGKGRLACQLSGYSDKWMKTVHTAYNFVGDVLHVEENVYTLNNGQRSFLAERRTDNTYHPGTRLISSTTITHTGKNGHTSTQTVSHPMYDVFGNVVANDRPGSAADMAYSYDTLHGWLTGISSPSGFSELLKRETATNAQFSGSIGRMEWQNSSNTVRHRYDFAYDELGRLTDSRYSSSNGTEERFDELVSYNANGSVTSLLRRGMMDNGTFGTIDDLTVSYDGNRLVKVTDDAESLNYNGALDFHDGADEDSEYRYDSNGALTYDSNRGIRSISYDYGHHPHTLLTTRRQYTYNDYTPDGIKLSSRHIGYVSAGHSAVRVTTTDLYIGDLILRDGTPLMWRFDGGYTELDANGVPTCWNYYVTDHLGSTRKVVDSKNVTKETISYYPFGSEMRMESPAQMTTTSWHPYRFSGKELDRQNGVNMYDFGARWYDVAGVPMWTSMDPLCEKYYHISPYAYCVGDPLNKLDPDGRLVVFVKGVSEIFKKNFKKAVRHLNEHGVGGMLKKLNDSKNTFYISELQEGPNNFDYKNNTISWNPYMGIKTNEAHYLSPTTLLNHEIDHALEFDKNPKKFKDNMIKYDDGHPDCFYNNPEEKRVITGTEQTTAKALGEITDNEVTRTDHMGVHILMDGPTSNRPIEKETEFIYTKERINER